MAVNVTFLGVTYSIPNTNGESGWGASLSSYLQALASGAATTSTVKQAIRTATASPVTVVAATDYTVVTNLTVPGAVAVNLPAGVAKQVFVIVDGKGDAATNAITIDGDGAETINGAANYVINENNGGVILQFSGTGWVALADFVGKDPTFTSVTVTSLRVSGLGLGIAHVDASGNFTSSAIVNADVSASAAIAYSKLNLATSIVNADISASANIVDSKLNTISTSGKVANSATTATSVNTASAIVQRDGSGDFAAGTITATAVAATSGTVGGVAITTASNTQALTNKTFDADGTGNSITNIENADIKAGAAIARAKLASGSNSHVVINDGSGVMSSEAQLAVARGGTGLGTLGTAGQLLRVNAGATALEYASTGSGDVVGPASSTDGRVAVFDGATGKLLKQDTRLAADLVAGVASSVNSEIALFSGTGGKTIQSATGTGYVKVSSGVFQTPSATVPGTDVTAAASGVQGVVTTGTQTFDGNKTFSGNITTNGTLSHGGNGFVYSATAGGVANGGIAGFGTGRGAGILTVTVQRTSNLTIATTTTYIMAGHGGNLQFTSLGSINGAGGAASFMVASAGSGTSVNVTNNAGGTADIFVSFYGCLNN